MRSRDFQIGERVILRRKRERVGARVTKVERCLRRIVTDMGERRIVHARQLNYPTRETFLMLESRLDRSLYSSRGQGEFIRELLHGYGARLLYERVHSKDDLRRFLRAEGRRPTVRMVHFCGHGHREGTFSLTFDEVDLTQDVELFRGMRGKILLFSSCEIGSLGETLQALVREVELAGIIAYRTEVEDTFANLADAMIYDRLLSTGASPRQAVRQVNAALKALGARPLQSGNQRGNILCCYD
ncbi:MAG: hypothetical protein M5U26_09275 [Planctomycetota bacterium]|nr:hypothetical protein [Planctomycetota bacterium]